MTIYFASDHAGFELKNEIIRYVRNELKYDVIDCGASVYELEDDYPQYMHAAAEYVARDPQHAKAIIFGGSGQGEAIVANRHAGVRAATYYGGPLEIISLSREHNDANVLSLGARFLTASEAREATRLWLATAFSQDERHVRRIRQIDPR